MAFRNSDGNFISAEYADMLGESYQEKIPEERVCLGCVNRYSSFSILMDSFTFGREIRLYAGISISLSLSTPPFDDTYFFSRL